MNNKFQIFNHFGRLPVGIIEHFNAMLGVKARPLLRKVLLGVLHVCKVRVSKSKFLCLAVMVNRIAYLRRHRGLKGLTLYLKTAFVVYQQSLGGQKLPNTASVSSTLVSRNNSGLPRIIPAHLRSMIRQEHLGMMRYVSSILNLYRDISYPGTPKLNTITAPFTGDVEAMETLRPLIPYFLQAFLPRGDDPKGSIQWKGRRLFLIWKAGPGMLKDTFLGNANYNSHPHNVLRALIALYKDEEIWNAFTYCVRFVEHRALQVLVDIFIRYRICDLPASGALGKLHAKEEPAGKVRLFAMVDAPTQWVLYPLHEFIMERLRLKPQDGTFDQTKPLGYLVGSKELYSYDLTAATDRLPLPVQKWILGSLFGDTYANMWATLLVKRSYGFYQMGYSKWAGSYKYAVGQPMGAYSSWAMLAMTHHFLVQVSAWRARVVPIGTWFTKYAVLGDDLVIANGAVAEAYLTLLKELGMPVNLHKSLVSKNGTCMEFAKRTIYKGNDISPVPIKEMNAAQGLAPAMVSFAIKYSLTLPQLLASFQYGWRNLSWLSKPLGELPSQIRTLVLAFAIPKSLEELPAFFNLGSKKGSQFVADALAIGKAFAEVTVPQLVKKVERKFSAVEELAQGKDSIVSEISTSIPSGLYQSIFERKSKDFMEPVLFGKGFVIYSPDKEDLEKQIRTLALASLTEDQRSGINQFSFTLYHLLYGRYITDYREVVLLVMRDLKALANRFMQISNTDALTLRPTRKSITQAGMDPNAYGFFHRYWDTLQALDELASISPAVLEFERPTGDEGIAASYGAVTPTQIRYYRLWSGVMQGTQGLDPLSVQPGAKATSLRPLEDVRV
jgi:hypothetical protein